MTTIATTTIDGFTVTIEPNEDREGVQCWVSKGRATSSLALVEDLGHVEDDREGTFGVREATIDRIRAYAERHGY